MHCNLKSHELRDAKCDLYCCCLQKYLDQFKFFGIFVRSMKIMSEAAVRQRSNMFKIGLLVQSWFRIGVVCHPLYMPDLAINDCHQILHIKTCITTQCFDNHVELDAHVRLRLNSEAAAFYKDEINKFSYHIPRRYS